MVAKRGGAAVASPVKRSKEECIHARVARSSCVCPSAWAKAVTPSSWVCHMSNRRGGSICGGSKFMCAQCGLIFCSAHTAAHGSHPKGGPHVGLDINSSEMFCFGCNSLFAMTSDHPDLLALHRKIADVIDQVDEVPSLTRQGTPICRTSSSDPSKIMLIQRNLGRVGAPSPRLKELARHEQHMTAGPFFIFAECARLFPALLLFAVLDLALQNFFTVTIWSSDHSRTGSSHGFSKSPAEPRALLWQSSRLLLPVSISFPECKR